MGTHKAKKIWSKLAFSAALIVILLFILFPIYWCLATSFKPSAEITSKTGYILAGSIYPEKLFGSMDEKRIQYIF